MSYRLQVQPEGLKKQEIFKMSKSIILFMFVRLQHNIIFIKLIGSYQENNTALTRPYEKILHLQNAKL